ncbi:hypothetical protein BASA50_006670 [Batrachochytrium salamandrivorans]|uniref:Anaphase-promoting complex subunit 4 WD40 domain-containing protein n=1 Tax=Batrachochytrium salamandrivorans TaxID=1357716 RepID=A0ABQ8F9B2_9FUNG|nr:hypothetical protein BASA60_005955 [Batrachochytrium salamandrivorans]KAH6594423.1 hypothetical protein BASA50_006670 [Batrachochytrium salamandrivorans]
MPNKSDLGIPESAQLHSEAVQSMVSSSALLSQKGIIPGKSPIRHPPSTSQHRSGALGLSMNSPATSKFSSTRRESAPVAPKPNVKVNEPQRQHPGQGKQSIHELKRVVDNNKEMEREQCITGCLKLRFSKTIETEIYSVKFSPNEDFIVTAGGNSNIGVFSTKTNHREHELVPDMAIPLPCTALCFRPDNSVYKSGNTLTAAYTDGSVRHWHYVTGQLIGTLTEVDNQINSVAYNRDGKMFVTGGSDMYVRAYDGPTQKLAFSAFSGCGEATAGHSNRIFCTKFHPQDTNMIISDFNDAGTMITTGSYAKDNQLQIWDWGSGQLVESIPWSETTGSDTTTCMLYSAQYSQSIQNGGTANRYIVAGGGGSINEARIFSNESKKSIGSVTHLSSAVYTTAISSQDKMMAVAGSGKTLVVCDIENHFSDSR